MAFTDAERVQMRRWMGGSFLFVNHEPRLESSFAAVEALPDSGATEDYITDTVLVRLEATFVELTKLESKLMALDVDEVKVDPVRAVIAIRQIGRMYSQQLATALGFTAPLTDAWGTIEPHTTQPLGQR